MLKLRALIAQGQSDRALAEISSDDSVPDLAAVKALAQYASADEESALQLAQDLAENYPDNATVQVLGGTVFQALGKSEEALALLAKHQGSLEAYVSFSPGGRRLCWNMVWRMGGLIG